jgi:arginine-tRNA-protein transferase
MIEETPVRSRVVEYYAPRPSGRGKDLVAVCLTDVLSDGVSMVYSFFDPDRSADSLGSFIILDHIAIARGAGVPYVYLGYWVPGSTKMDYKARYRPLEIFAEGRWSEFGETDLGRIGRSATERTAIGEQVSAIELPVTK